MQIFGGLGICLPQWVRFILWHLLGLLERESCSVGIKEKIGFKDGTAGSCLGTVRGGRVREWNTCWAEQTWMIRGTRSCPDGVLRVTEAHLEFLVIDSFHHYVSPPCKMKRKDHTDGPWGSPSFSHLVQPYIGNIWLIPHEQNLMVACCSRGENSVSS